VKGSREIVKYEDEPSGLIATLKKLAPWMENPEPELRTEVIERDGISYQEAVRLMKIDNAVQEHRREQREKMRRAQERKNS